MYFMTLCTGSELYSDGSTCDCDCFCLSLLLLFHLMRSLHVVQRCHTVACDVFLVPLGGLVISWCVKTGSKQIVLTQPVQSHGKNLN